MSCALVVGCFFVSIFCALGAENNMVRVLPATECAVRLEAHYQYLVKHTIFADLCGKHFSVCELRKLLKSACLRYFMYCGIKECRVAHWWVPVEGELSTCLITQSLRDRMAERAEREVAEFFRQYPCATLQTILVSDVWRSLPSIEHWSNPFYRVHESDVDCMVEEVFNAIVETLV